MTSGALFMIMLPSVLGLAMGGEAISSQDVCQRYPKRVKKLFVALDLKRKGLETVRAAAGKKDWPAACDALIAYYRDGKTAAWLRLKTPRPGKGRQERADAILKDTFTIQNVTARQPRLKSGRLDWQHNGPRKDREWGWLLNRHPHFVMLLRAWRKTGNPEYARCFDAHVRDWVTSMAYPGKRTTDAQWRGLEVGLRVRGSWPKSFYGFQGAKEFTPAARILMLSSVPDHADNLIRFHARGSNWTLMQMCGLANAAACWPEFRDASKWFSYASKVMTAAIGSQIYPDGVQRELTSSYHRVCVDNFEPFAEIAARLDRKLPKSYLETLEAMRSYLAYSMRPSGHGPLNNDSDLPHSRRYVLKGAERYKRDDWAYIASNGKQGKKPRGLPSRVFPWAGQAVMRSGWDADAHWSFFDVGPAGIAHQHKDRLHLSVAAFGRDLLVDAGRYCYKRDKWSDYFRGASSHNLVLVDGCGQKTGKYSVRKAMRGNFAVTPKFDYTRGVIDQGYIKLEGQASHTRAVVYVRGRFWVVFDRILSDRPRKLEALWHFHPGCAVKSKEVEAFSTDRGKGNLRIVPAGGPKWRLKLVKGRVKPTIQGWYSPTYNVKHPNTTAVYSAKAGKNATFAWLLFPARGAVPEIKVEALPAPQGAMRVRITPPDGKPCEVAVRFSGKTPVPLSGGMKLDGDCAVLGISGKPGVVGGRVLGANGKVLAEHAYGN
jgi:Heparinase II/III N-terminus/Heparinase II/III-like protein